MQGNQQNVQMAYAGQQPMYGQQQQMQGQQPMYAQQQMQMTPEQQQQYMQMQQQQQMMMMQQQQQQQQYGQQQAAYGMQAPQNPQMMQQQPGQSPYPTAPPLEVQNQVKKAKKKEKAANSRAALNAVVSLRDDPDRQRFVVKTYGIVATMLTFTSIVTAAVYSSESAKDFIRDNYYLHYVALIIGIALLCTLTCCQKHARKVPRNYILLAAFTVCWTYMVAGFTQWFEPEDVMIATVMTAAMVIGLTVIAFFCKVNLNVLFAVASAGSFCILPLFLFCIIFPSKLLFNILAFFVIILTSIYIVFDTKMILEKLELDEYIIGALMLYVDIIQLFMWLLSLLGNN